MPGSLASAAWHDCWSTCRGTVQHMVKRRLTPDALTLSGYARMVPSLLQSVLGLVSGSLVGFSLGLVGGGGSILAVPLLVYVVGVSDPHVAIGTSAVAVAANAAGNLLSHHRARNVVWRCALLFAATGVVGAFLGSTLGKMVNGQRLLAAFVLMMVVAGLMLRKRASAGIKVEAVSRDMARRLVAIGLGAGALSGFFGIGG